MAEKKPPIGRTGEYRFTAELEAQVAAAEATDLKSIPSSPDTYPEPGSAKAELKAAGEAWAAFSRTSANMIQSVRLGQRLELEPVNGPLVAMTESVIRHPDSMVWMTRLDEPESYLVGHSQRCAVLAAVVGRSLGFQERQLQRLAWAGLLCQIGKTRIPRSMREKPGPLTEEEVERNREFVALGVEVLRNSRQVSEAIIEAVQNHHERLDGSGYPQGLKGDRIPVLARIVGLVDWYDAMISKKPYTDNVMTATQAMDHMHRQRNRLFQDQIVEAFVRAVGLYPTGTLVELTTSEIALVAAQHLGHRTQPEVILVLDRYRKPFRSLERLDLREHNRKNPSEPCMVKVAISDGEYGLSVRDIMARSSERKGWRRFLPGS